MSNRIQVIDLFAGAGGLSEGFATFRPKKHAEGSGFEVSIAAEMNCEAHASLQLRAFYRRLVEREGGRSRTYRAFLRACATSENLDPETFFSATGHKRLWAEASRETPRLTLGQPSDDRLLTARARLAARKDQGLVIVGGPPCQAYSLVGRSRKANVPSFRERGDDRTFLYREYVKLIASCSPDVFVMENVRGLLSSKVGGRRLMDEILQQLSRPSENAARRSKRGGPEYVIVPVHVPRGQVRDPNRARENPSEFLVKCEEHGIAQARHRVLIMGVRADHWAKARHTPGFALREAPSFTAIAGNLPRLRSGLSRGKDDADRWLAAVETQRMEVLRAVRRHRGLRSDGAITSILKDLAFESLPRDAASSNQKYPLLHHGTRTHMPSDLGRYVFCAAYARARGVSPRSSDFPSELAPKHRNWDTGKFADRFKVQVEGRPAATVTCHLAKDGHAFIHPDPAQARSLTVREAARLQTFPDDYFFVGSRTAKFNQVGNAVPPALARQVAGVVWGILNE